MNLGRLARDASGANGLLRQAASIIANPLVRNKVTFLEALDPESPYFDITTPLVLLEAKGEAAKPDREADMSIRDYLEAATKGTEKGRDPRGCRVFDLAVRSRRSDSSASRGWAERDRFRRGPMKLVRTVCIVPEIVVSSLTLIPLRAKLARKGNRGKPANEGSIKKASEIAADEILAWPKRITL